MSLDTLSKVSFLAFSSRLIQVLIRIGVLVILGKILAPEELGAFSLLTTISFTLSLFFLSGQYQAVSILLVQGYNPKRLFQVSIILILIISAFILTNLLLFEAKMFAFFSLNTSFFSVWDIFILLVCFSLNGLIYKFHEGLKEVGSYSKVSAISLNLPWIFILISYLISDLDYYSVVNLYVLGNIASLIVVIPSFYLVYRRHRDDNENSVVEFRNFVKQSLLLYSSNFGFWLYTKSDVFVIQYFLGTSALGVFSLVTKIAESIQVLGTSIGSVYAPKIAIDFHNRVSYVKSYCQSNHLIILLYLPIGVVLFCGSEFLISTFFSKEYYGAITFLQIYVIFIMFRGFSGTYSLLLDGLGFAKYRSSRLIFFAVANIIFNILIIPTYGVLGVCLVTICTYVPLVSIYIYKVQKVLKLRFIDVFKRNFFYVFFLLMVVILFTFIFHDPLSLEKFALLLIFSIVPFILHARNFLISSRNVKN